MVGAYGTPILGRKGGRKGSAMTPLEQESPAIADKPARRESLPKLLQFGVPSTLSLTILA